MNGDDGNIIKILIAITTTRSIGDQLQNDSFSNSLFSGSDENACNCSWCLIEDSGNEVGDNHASLTDASLTDANLIGIQMKIDRLILEGLQWIEYILQEP